MNKMNNTPMAEAEGKASGGGEHKLNLGIRLQAVEHSDQPVFSNFAMVQGAPGMVFLDFGFLEPNALPSVLRAAQSGGKVPEAIGGKLAARVVLGIDSAVQLAQQLQQHLRSLQAQGQKAAEAPAQH